MIGYGVANAFLCVYDMGVDTMLMCYAEATFQKSEDENGCCDNNHNDKNTLHIPSELTGKVDYYQKKRAAALADMSPEQREKKLAAMSAEDREAVSAALAAMMKAGEVDDTRGPDEGAHAKA